MGYESQKYRLFSPALGNFFSDPKGVIESWRRQTFGFQKEEPKRVGYEIGIEVSLVVCTFFKLDI